MNKKDKLLIELIKNVKLDTPNPDFTNDLLDTIKEEEFHLLEKDTSLKNILHRNILINPPDDFVNNVVLMAKKTEKNNLNKPLISIRSKFIVFSIIIILSLVAELKNDSQGIFTNLFSDIFNKLLLVIKQTPILLSLSIITITLLLILDSILRKVNTRHLT